MVLRAYFDESGKLADHQFVVFGGCIAPEPNWEVITTRWNEHIFPRGLSCISMKDAMNFRGQFAGWTNRMDERDEMLYELLDMSFPLIDAFVTSPMSTAEFNALSPENRRLVRNPQYCGFEGCMRLIVSGMKPEDDLHVICDSSEEYSPQMLKLYIQLRTKNEEFKKRCAAITFAEDHMFPPLQLADMVAYCARQRLALAEDVQYPIVKRVMDRLESTKLKTKFQGYAVGGLGLGHGILETE